MEKADLVIIGAGIYGLTAAATYHRLQPSATIRIIDAAPGVGGPWASHRIFPGLRTNNLHGMYEHPDFPMDEARFGVRKGEYVPAEKMLEYLEALVEWAEIGPFLQLSTKVELIEKEDGGWRLRCTSSLDTDEHAVEICTHKLIVAVGTANKPFMPVYTRAPTFTPPVIHSKDLPSHYIQIVKPGTHTLVIGGGKSAWDVSYACATQPDATVTILIRPSGNGPNWLAPSHVTPFKIWLEKLVFTRFLGLMSPCPWASTSGIEGWLRSFFHGTWLGRKITAAFWTVLSDDVVALTGLDGHPATKKLRPWRDGFEIGTCLSIHNYPTSFFDLVRQGRIKLVFDQVSGLDSDRSVRLESGDTLQVDAVVCATGWQIGQALNFSPESLNHTLGLPSRLPPSPADTALIQKTEAELCEAYPILNRDTSRTHHPDPSLRYTQPPIPCTPHRLHRFMIPPALLPTRSLAFAGALQTLGTFPCAYLQSLWISAYLTGTLPLPGGSDAQIRADVFRDSQYCVIRGRTGRGSTLPDLVFDTLPYFDCMLRDLKLAGRRKGGVLGVREYVTSHGPSDWRGCVGEWEGELRRKAEAEEGKKVI